MARLQESGATIGPSSAHVRRKRHTTPTGDAEPNAAMKQGV